MPDFEGQSQPNVEIKDLAGILQKDELFQEYQENARKKVQSAFLLPDLYVGYTSDFNRATSQTAMEVTEKQVFQPERERLAWVLNNKLLNGYGFKYVEAKVGDLYKIQVGAFAKKENAEAMEKQIRSFGFTDTFITTQSVAAVKLDGTAKKSNTEVAKEVIAGKWGNEPERSKKLKAAGYDAEAIQSIVNELMR